MLTTKRDDPQRWEESRAFYAFVKDQVISKIQAATLPLVKANRLIHGTAFAVRDAERWFLVSAGHVIGCVNEGEVFIPTESSEVLLDLRRAGEVRWVEYDTDDPERFRVDVGSWISRTMPWRLWDEARSPRSLWPTREPSTRRGQQRTLGTPCWVPHAISSTDRRGNPAQAVLRELKPIHRG